MTLSEFKAWFEGFTEAMDGPPDAKQWARIQSKVKEIADKPAVAYREPFRPPTVRPFVGQPVTLVGDLPRNGGMAVDMVEAVEAVRDGKTSINAARAGRGLTAINMVEVGRREFQGLV
jgi:hypothetical protein